MRDTTSKVVVIDHKGCDAVKVELNKLTVTFHNRLSGNFWQKEYKAADLSVDQILKWKNGTFIQIAMPGLDANDREHFLTGFTQKETDDIFS